jgi:hypothetical protein
MNDEELSIYVAEILELLDEIMLKIELKEQVILDNERVVEGSLKNDLNLVICLSR